MSRLFFLFILLTMVAACKKGEESSFPEGWSDNTYGPDFHALYDPLSPSKQELTLSATTPAVCTTRSGIRFTIADSTFSRMGTPVPNADLKISVVEFFTNKDLVSGELTTTASSTAAGRDARITGGAFYLVVTATDGTYLETKKPVGVSVPEQNGNFSPDFGLYAGLRPVAATAAKNYVAPYISWVIPTPAVSWQRGTYGTLATYDFSIPAPGYWSLLRPVAAGPGTDISVKLPAGFGNVNTNIYILQPQNGMKRMSGNYLATCFTTDVTAGLPFKMLTLANKGGHYYYDLRTCTAVNNDTLTIADLPEADAAAVSDVIARQLN